MLVLDSSNKTNAIVLLNSSKSISMMKFLFAAIYINSQIKILRQKKKPLHLHDHKSQIYNIVKNVEPKY